MKGEERRKHIRVFLPGGQVRLSCGPLLVLVGKIVDLSLGGIKIVCESQFACSEEVDLEVVLPSGLKFSCTARIVNLEGSEERETQSVAYRLKFVNLTERQKKGLGEYILKVRAAQDMVLKKEIVDNEDSFRK